MASIVIRDLPEHVVSGLEERAATEGKSREVWLREQLTALASAPVVRKTYALRAFKEGVNGGTLQIARWPDGSVEIVKQYRVNAAVLPIRELVIPLMQHNEPGDREAAMHLLRQHYDQVFETTV